MKFFLKTSPIREDAAGVAITKEESVFIMSQASVTTENKFYPEMTVGEALRVHPEVGIVLASYHLGGCSHCGINEIETLEQVCQGYGVPIDALVASLNSLLEEEE